MSNTKKLKIIFIVNHLAFFISHRLPLAIAAIKNGYEVELITGQPGSVTMENYAEEKLSEFSIKHSRVFFAS